jgi:hypothetical protein
MKYDIRQYIMLIMALITAAMVGGWIDNMTVERKLREDYDKRVEEIHLEYECRWKEERDEKIRYRDELVRVQLQCIKVLHDLPDDPIQKRYRWRRRPKSWDAQSNTDN